MDIHKLNYNEVSEALGYFTEEEQLRLYQELEARVFQREADSFKLTPAQEREMQQSLEEADNGEFIDHDEVVARAKSWFTR